MCEDQDCLPSSPCRFLGNVSSLGVSSPGIWGCDCSLDLSFYEGVYSDSFRRCYRSSRYDHRLGGFWVATRVFMSLLYFGFLVYSTRLLYRDFLFHKPSSSFLRDFSPTTFSLSMFFVYNLLGFLFYSIDPYGFSRVSPGPFWKLLVHLQSAIVLLTLSIVPFFWSRLLKDGFMKVTFLWKDVRTLLFLLLVVVVLVNAFVRALLTPNFEDDPAYYLVIVSVISVTLFVLTVVYGIQVHQIMKRWKDTTPQSKILYERFKRYWCKMFGVYVVIYAPILIAAPFSMDHKPGTWVLRYTLCIATHYFAIISTVRVFVQK